MCRMSPKIWCWITDFNHVFNIIKISSKYVHFTVSFFSFKISANYAKNTSALIFLLKLIWKLEAFQSLLHISSYLPHLWLNFFEDHNKSYWNTHWLHTSAPKWFLLLQSHSFSQCHSVIWTLSYRPLRAIYTGRCFFNHSCFFCDLHDCLVLAPPYLTNWMSFDKVRILPGYYHYN